MSFVDTIYENLGRRRNDPVVTEMHDGRPVPTTGRQLADVVARIRGALRARGVRPGDHVALLGSNRTRWVAADLAIMGEGAVCLPLYARQEAAELVWMIRHSESKLAVVIDPELARSVEDEWRKAADAGEPPTVLLDELLSGDPVDGAPHAFEPEDAVTLFYTSGTSGTPKGVMLTAANVGYMLPVTHDSLRRLMGDRSGEDRVFHYLPFCFAGSRIVLWTCLFRGTNITLSTDLDALATEIAAARPHYFLNVPTLLERMKGRVEDGIRERGGVALRLYEAATGAWQRRVEGRPRAGDAALLAAARRIVLDPIRKRLGPELKCLICGSAPLSEATQRWFEMIGIPVYQVYGLTETTAIVTMDEPGDAIPGRVGRVIPGCEAKLGPGDELLVRGPNVFPGHWKRPDATAEVFAGDWFRTGDRAEVDAGGRWRILGRVKDVLVPTSGHNIAPEPLEHALVERTAGVEHAVVIGHGRPFLTAIVSGAAEHGTVQQTVDALNAELPHYRRIRAFHLTTEPFTSDNGLLTANQKLKRDAVEAHFQNAIEAMYLSSRPSDKGARPTA